MNKLGVLGIIAALTLSIAPSKAAQPLVIAGVAQGSGASSTFVTGTSGGLGAAFLLDLTKNQGKGLTGINIPSIQSGSGSLAVVNFNFLQSDLYSPFGNPSGLFTAYAEDSSGFLHVTGGTFLSNGAGGYKFNSGSPSAWTTPITSDDVIIELGYIFAGGKNVAVGELLVGINGFAIVAGNAPLSPFPQFSTVTDALFNIQ